MKKTIVQFSSLLMLVVVMCGAASAQATPAAKSGAGLRMPPYRKVALKNGMTVLLMERRQVPLLSLNYIVRAGSVSDPKGKEGLASATAALLRKGTKTRTAEQISQQLDFIGASFTTFANADLSGGRAEFMKKDIAKGLELFADLLLNPTFPQDEVKKLIAQRVDGVRAAKDRAQGVIPEYYHAFLFGGHPYGRPVGGDERSLTAITRDDIAAFYQSGYAPGNMILAVVGDFNAAEMEKMISDRLGNWTVKGAAPAAIPAPQMASGKRLLLVDKPDSTQTYYMIGNTGVARTNDDRVGIEIVNTLFGGRFTSMINSALRIKSGLTYGARSEFEMMKAPGAFYISTYTRNESTEKAIDMTLDVLRQLHEKGITEEELRSAKEYIKGTLPPQRLETNDQLAALLTELQFYGLSDAEINDYYAKVDAMTLADSRRIIKQYFPLENLAFVLVGKASDIGTVAKKYAPEVKTKSIVEPGF